MLFNVSDKNIKQKLERQNSNGEFMKYPLLFLSKECVVKINRDDFLFEDEFIIKTKYPVLPRRIYIYGKEGRSEKLEDHMFLNYWLEIFLKTIEQGKIVSMNFSKSTDKTELAIGLSWKFRRKAFDGSNWNKKDIIKFISCLFNIVVEEIDYQQQDFIELLIA